MINDTLIQEYLEQEQQINQSSTEMVEANVNQDNKTDVDLGEIPENTDVDKNNTSETDGDFIKNSAETNKDEPAVEEVQNQQNSNPVLDWNFLAEKTQGLIKGEDSIPELLSKVSEIESLSTKVKELETNQFKPANDFVDKFNKLISEGATVEQQVAFFEINRLGDLNSMSPREILVTREMLIGGASRDVAEFAIDSKYDTSLMTDDSIEYKALMYSQSKEANEALKELNTYKADLSTIKNESKEENEKARLEEIHKENVRTSIIKQEVPKLAKSFNSKINFSIDDKNSFEHSYDEKFKVNVESHIQDFFDKTKLPITNESLNQLSDYLEVKYISENRDLIIKDIYNKLESKIREEFASKYENRSGLPEEKNNPNPAQEKRTLTQSDVAASIGLI